MVYTTDLKSVTRKSLRVRVPSPLPDQKNFFFPHSDFYIFFTLPAIDNGAEI